LLRNISEEAKKSSCSQILRYFTMESNLLNYFAAGRDLLRIGLKLIQA